MKLQPETIAILRNPPKTLSRQQVLNLDALRYAAEMASVAYDRLCRVLMDAPATEPDSPEQFRKTATAMSDAWSIVDAAHRFGDFIEHFPGLRNTKLRKAVKENTDEVDRLRNAVQHQLRAVNTPSNTSQHLWGFISWAEYRNGAHTGWWKMIAAGSHYKGDEFLFIGPIQAPPNVPVGHVRLNAFGNQVYLGKLVSLLIWATGRICEELKGNRIKSSATTDIEWRGADWSMKGLIEAWVSVPKSHHDST